MNPVIVIAGPTASGKNDLALKIAKKINGYIINADSRQIYKEITIGTAKPVPERIVNRFKWLIDGVDHCLYGFLPIKKDYNIFKYQKDVHKILNLPENRDRIPILVGGTGLYIDSVVFGYNLPTFSRFKILPKDKDNLKKLLGENLQDLNESDANNPRRLISFLKRKTKPSKQESFNVLYLVLDVEKELLNERIQKRVKKMFKNGLLSENEKLFRRYRRYTLPGLNTIGYKEFEGYFKKANTIKEVEEEIFVHTRQYAKRQRTWFKRNSKALYVKNFKEASYFIGKFLKTL